jgi:pimeloyl-ACP methyl ester carboxylesterase
MHTHRPHRRPRFVLWLLGALVAALLVPSLGGLAGASQSAQPTSKPTIVLVHGAFADASGWAGVIGQLQRRGYPVVAPPNPLRSVAGDSAYLAGFLKTLPGNIVLVGHSYGGMVTTNAAVGNPNVKALVYIAAFAPDEGDTVAGLSTKFPGSMLTQENLDLRPVTLPDGTASFDAYIKQNPFREVFAADVSRSTTAAMAASQRPAAVNVLSEPSGPPAWKSVRSWFLVARRDNTIPAAAERFMAERARSTVIEINSSHVAMISHPTATADLIVSAANTVR